MVWRYFDRSDRLVGESERFEHAEAAEEWMAAVWSELRERGVEEVELVDVDRDQVSYRMALSESEG